MKSALLNLFDQKREEPKGDGSTEIELPPGIQAVYEQHKRLAARETVPVFWNPITEMYEALVEERKSAEENDHAWATLRVSNMKTRDAKNPDRNPEIFFDKPIIIEE